MRGGARRYFKIPPVIDHQAGSFLVDRLRLLGALLMPLHWRRFLLITLFVAAGVGAFVLGGGPQTIFTGAIPTETDTVATGTTSEAKPDSMQGPIAEETPKQHPTQQPMRQSCRRRLKHWRKSCAIPNANLPPRWGNCATARPSGGGPAWTPRRINAHARHRPPLSGSAARCRSGLARAGRHGPVAPLWARGILRCQPSGTASFGPAGG